tara:strand:+ start:164 stop:334 length:171 start_codon:yes stop_codon:yes gene_type:complete
MIIFTLLGILTAIFFFIVIIMTIVEIKIKSKTKEKLFWEINNDLTDSDLIDEIQKK